MAMKTITSTGKNQKRIRKVGEESVKVTFFDKYFYENFIHNSLNVFSEQIGTISIRMMW